MLRAVASWARQDWTFRSGDYECAAWLYLPAGAPPMGQWPCVVMGHGFGGTRQMLLDTYAECFAAQGYAVFVFDYRGFGDSGGTPRQVLNIAHQLADWHAALQCVRSMPMIDTKRLALWGTSLGGGHVLSIAAKDQDIAAVIAQVPHCSGAALPGSVGLRQSLRLAWPAARDALRGLLRQQPLYIDIIGEPGSVAAMTAPGAMQAAQFMMPKSGQAEMTISARAILEMLRYAPGKTVAAIRCPVLVLIAEHDKITPPGPALAAAKRLVKGEIMCLPATHFEMYVGPLFKTAVERQIAFLHVALARGENKVQSH